MDISALIIQMQYNGWILEANSAGVTDEESVKKLEPGGNSYNWIVGHILATRNIILKLLGKDPVWNPALEKRYTRGSANITSLNDACSLQLMLSDLKKSTGSIVQGMRTVTPETLAAKAPFSPGNEPDETIASLLAMLVFHESYHAGQTGIVRRLLGKSGAIP
ncbi:DinB family protein [bacterium]|nr:DinB family protein [candidate division CSSED10-310 bacterium]